ncbi:transporter substrate-binding domain-containing protein [Undibacterium cyanobacteriorum]|uniref:Transporter substrate-binding domain-containing protein n=1 Tax=Undibacterium cyanobacteriorum TaxID=3073561 RepID=A0ABY9RIE1_9BURK|nr:transporter substrate-binding domain-containing protein [Undibacterium sp. 20NA77.5]WMW80716.1 transporter substrate-binding domain-containing protein [Undibacterium sp. 20NA77.5]
MALIQYMLRSFLLLLGFFGVVLNSHAQTPLRACGGDSTWPPMSYLNPKDKSVQGFSIEVLKAIFETPPRVQLRPWARCLAEVENMQGSDILISAFKTPEREAKFLFSRPYFSLTPAYFYAKHKFSTPPISQKSDLARYKICSLHGAAISYSGLSNEQIESGATNYVSLFKKIERGHCDIVVDMEEVFLGFDHLGTVNFAAKEFEIRPLPDTERFPLHFAVSLTHPQAHRIIEQINRGIASIQKNGRLKQLQDRFQAQRR